MPIAIQKCPFPVLGVITSERKTVRFGMRKVKHVTTQLDFLARFPPKNSGFKSM